MPQDPMYPAGVSDNDPHFDLPSVGDDEGDDAPPQAEGPRCPKCGHAENLNEYGYCQSLTVRGLNPICGCKCEFPAAVSAQVDAPSNEQGAPPFTLEQHHELCLGVMASCYPFVDAELKQAIREGIQSAALLGIPVDCRNLEKGGPLFTGGQA